MIVFSRVLCTVQTVIVYFSPGKARNLSIRENSFCPIKKMGCVELYIHITQGQKLTHSPIGFCINLLVNVSVSVSVPVLECEPTTRFATTMKE